MEIYNEKRKWNMVFGGQLKKEIVQYHAVQAKKSFGPSSGLSFAKLYMNVYISTVGSATPRINRGWPPMIECIIPHNAVEARV